MYTVCICKLVQRCSADETSNLQAISKIGIQRYTVHCRYCLSTVDRVDIVEYKVHVQFNMYIHVWYNLVLQDSISEATYAHDRK